MSNAEAGSDRINRGIFSSNTDEWATPKNLFRALDAEFNFTLDPCADETNAKCARYFTEADDGLAQPWDGIVFMNPPYGRDIGKWVKKAYEESLRGATVVCLIPARTDTAYWHDYAMQADEVRFIRGRLHFGGEHERTAHNAPFPSAVVVFRPHRWFAALSSMARPTDAHPDGETDADLREAAAALLRRYIQLVESGDCGNWDAEDEPEVRALREALSLDGEVPE
jgi:site-specific DNA-methyltransferase (adenine-specific)